MEINKDKVEETTEAVPAETNEAEETSTEESEAERSQPELDYKALYESEKDKLSKAEFALYKKKKAEKEARQQVEAETGVIDPDEVQRLVEEKALEILQQQRQRESEEVLEEELGKLSKDEDERRLIRLMYENRIQQTGYTRSAIREDLQTAALIANAPKYQRENAEKIEALKAKASLQGSGAAVGTNQDRPVLKDDLSKHFSESEWKFMQNRQWTEKQIREAADAKRTGGLSRTFS